MDWRPYPCNISQALLCSDLSYIHMIVVVSARRAFVGHSTWKHDLHRISAIFLHLVGHSIQPEPLHYTRQQGSGCPHQEATSGSA